MNQGDPSELTVVCHVRTSLFLEPIDAKVQTLRRCEDTGTIGGLVLRTWPDQVRLDEDSPYQESIDTYERYSQWAAARDLSIEPPFSVRTASSMATDEEWEVLVTPILCIGLYQGEELVGVFPHEDDTEIRDATDAIASLRTGELPPPIDPDRQGTTVTYTEPVEVSESDATTACPSCDGSVVNVHGLLACTECQWTDVTEPPIPAAR